MNAERKACGSMPYRTMKLLGTILILLSVGILLYGVPVMSFLAFQEVANHPGQPRPEDLAAGLARGYALRFIALPIGLIGIVFYVLGVFFRRRSVKRHTFR